MQGKVDLHIHTYHSDGVLTPLQIINKAAQNGISILSITDHDTVSAIPEAIEEGNKRGIEVISGVELSSDVADREVHILGYFIDIENKELKRYLSFFRDERMKRAERIIAKLKLLGINISLSEVLENSKGSAVGRPHIAQALLKKGYIENFFEAFQKYIGNSAPAYEKKVHISPSSAFKIINDAGGLSFIAHPGYMLEGVLKSLIDAGVDGIEVVHPSHNNQQVKYYTEIANSYFLLTSGGSDFHGGKRNDEENFGKFFTSISSVDAMRLRLLKNTA